MIWLLASLAFGKTLAVCDTGGSCYTTLDDAVAAADAGDSIALESGTHTSSGVVLNTSNVTVFGYAGSILELDGPIEVTGEGVAIQNLTLTGSSDVLVSVSGAQGVTLSDVVVSGHTSVAESALVVRDGAAVTMLHPTLSGNTGVDGASIRVVDATLDIVGSGGSISGDVATGRGGSLWMDNSAVSVSGLTLSGSSAARGGAIYAVGGSLTVDGVTFDATSANVGGAIYGEGTAIVLADVVVSGSAATNDGGVILAEGGSVDVRDSLVCATTGSTQLHFSGADVTVTSTTVREGQGPALQSINGTLSVEYVDLLSNASAVKVEGVDAVVTNTLVALHSQQALVATTGSISVSHSAFWGNLSDGDGAPGTEPQLDDPLLDFTPGVCGEVALDPLSPILYASNEGRAIGAWQDDIPQPPVDTGDSGLLDTGRCESTDTGRACDDGIPGPYPDTGPFIDTGREEPGPVDTVDTSIWLIETGSDNDTGERPPRDTGVYYDTAPPEPPTDGDSGDTAVFVGSTGDTGFNDQDRWTALTADTGATASTADTNGSMTFTGDTGTAGGTGSIDTGPTTGSTNGTTPPTGTDGIGGTAAQTPFFTCSTAGSSPGAWWLLALVPFARRRRS